MERVRSDDHPAVSTPAHEHDFADVDGVILDDAVCSVCGLPVMDGNLLPIDIEPSSTARQTGES